MRSVYQLTIVAALLSQIFVSGGAGAQSSTTKLSPRFGAILTLSGGFASAGEDCRRGIEAGLNNSNSSIKAVYADSKNSSPDALSEFRRLKQSPDTLAIYTHRSSVGMALNPVSQSNRMPLIGAVGHQDFATSNPYAFQAWPRSDIEGRFFAEELIKRGQKEATLIYTEDEWTSSVSEGFRTRYNELGGALVIDQGLLPAETDLRTTLLKAIRANKNAPIFLNLLLPQIAPSLKQGRELGITAPLYFNFFISRQEILDAVGREALEGVHYAELDTNLPKLKQSLGLAPDANLPGLTVASYVSASLLAQAMSVVPPPQSPEQLYQALLKQREVRTADALYPIHDRQIGFALVMKRFKNGTGVASSQ